jgi:hypothetical protein
MFVSNSTFNLGCKYSNSASQSVIVMISTEKLCNEGRRDRKVGGQKAMRIWALSTTATLEGFGVRYGEAKWLHCGTGTRRHYGSSAVPSVKFKVELTEQGSLLGHMPGREDEYLTCRSWCSFFGRVIVNHYLLKDIPLHECPMRIHVGIDCRGPQPGWGCSWMAPWIGGNVKKTLICVAEI